MANRIAPLLADLAAHLNAMPGVFSTAQWGGRAYKVGRSGNRKKARLLAFVAPARGADALHVSFKLSSHDARDAVERYGWVEPHSFRTLAPAGWLSATVSTKRQLGPLKRLLAESHRLHGGRADGESAGRRRRSSHPVTRRIDQVMDDLAAGGWSPQSDW